MSRFKDLRGPTVYVTQSLGLGFARIRVGSVEMPGAREQSVRHWPYEVKTLANLETTLDLIQNSEFDAPAADALLAGLGYTRTSDWMGRSITARWAKVTGQEEAASS